MTTTKKIAVAVLVFTLAAVTWWSLATGDEAVVGEPAVVVAPLQDGVGSDVPTSPLNAAAVQPLTPVPGALPTDAHAAAGALADLDPDLMRVHITGRVLDGRGNPFPGVLLTLFPEQATLERLGLPHEVYELLDPYAESSLEHATSDAQGRFVLEGVRLRGAEHELSFGTRQHQRILARVGGLAWHGFTVTGLADDGDHDMGDLIVDAPEIKLRARFVDEAGAPVEGVALLVNSWNGDATVVQHPAWAHWVSWMRWVDSDAEGRVRMRGLWPGWFSLRRQHHSYLVDEDERFSVWVAPGEAGDLGTLVMQAGGAVSGWVLGADGLPLEGAEVFAPGWDLRKEILRRAGVVSDGGDASRAALLLNWVERMRLHAGRSLSYVPAHTDADGFFRQQGLADSTADLVVAAAGYEPLLVTDVAIGSAPLEWRLLPSATAQVAVVSAADDRPLPGAMVRGFRRSGVIDKKGVEVRASLATAEPTGVAATWRLTGLGPDGADVEVSAEGFATGVLSVPGLSPGQHVTLRLALQQGARLNGRLIDDAGQPIFRGRLTLTAVPESDAASADVRGDVRAHEPTLSSPVAPRELLTDAAGTFVFEGLAAGRWQLEVQARGFRVPEPLHIDLSPGETQDLAPIVLGNSGRIGGLLVSTTGHPVADVSVGLWPREGDRRSVQSAVTDGNGRFLLMDIPAGDYLMMSNPGVQIDIMLSAGEQLDLVLTQRKPPRLHGQVTSGGLPVEGARLDFHENLESTWRGSRTTGYLGRTDADGHYDVAFHDTGLLRLEVISPDGGGIALPVQLDWDDDRRLDIALGTAEILGRLHPLPAPEPEADEEPLGTAVLVSLDNASRLRTRRLAADGRFRFGYVAAGRYRVLVPEPGQELHLDGEELDSMGILASTEIELVEGQTLELVLEPGGG